MKKNENVYKRNKTLYIVSIAVIFSICFLSIGYSAYSNSLRIEGILAKVRPVASARITNVTLNNTTNGGVSNSEDFTQNKLLGNISLPNQDSTVTYRVDVTVFLSSEMKLSSITGLDSNLEYSISGYNMGDILCNANDECNLGATDDIYITIGYKSGEYDPNNTTYNLDLNFNFEVVQIVAKIGNARYQTLQAAINDVPTNNTQTTIDLLLNTSEVLTVSTGQNIVFNMHGNTISNNGTHNVIVNTGTIRMSDGTIMSNTSQGAINNNAGGVFIMTGGTISATGTRQAIYNDGGTLTISGNATLRATSTQRAPLHNLNNGTVTITGGRIESTNFSGIENHANLTIGIKDGVPDNTPIIMGRTYGVLSDTNFNYYDGIIKGVTNAFDDENYIDDTETSLTMMRSTETINTLTYKVVQLGIPITITFNANGGTCSESSRNINKGGSIGTLPIPTRTTYNFDGWFTAASGGSEVTSSTTFSDNDEIFAHWSQTIVAKIGNAEYPTVHSAVSAVPANTPTTIDIVKDIVLSEVIEIPANKNITFDLNNHTLSNRIQAMPIFETKGTSVIENGTVTTDGTQGAINNRTSGANTTLSNLTVIATGTRQALYNAYGTTTITGNCHLSNTTSERAAVHNLNNGTVIILSGTIESENHSGVYSESGTIIIGTKDGNISTTNPSIKGSLYGVNAVGTLKFYDGVLKGKTDAYNGTISDSDGTPTAGIEVIGGATYKTSHLE